MIGQGNQPLPARPPGNWSTQSPGMPNNGYGQYQMTQQPLPKAALEQMALLRALGLS